LCLTPLCEVATSNESEKYFETAKYKCEKFYQHIFYLFFLLKISKIKYIFEKIRETANSIFWLCCERWEQGVAEVCVKILGALGSGGVLGLYNFYYFKLKKTKKLLWVTRDARLFILVVISWAWSLLNNDITVCDFKSCWELLDILSTVILFYSLKYLSNL
jgi:hypothetical protein